MNTEMEVLLIEDKRSDAEMTIRALTKNNITTNIVHVKDGKAALDFLFGTGAFASKDLSKKPKLVILDLKMPKVSGLEVLKRIKENELTKEIPVVVLTSSNENSDIKKCYELGVNSYVVKPVAFDDFTKVVSELGLYWMRNNKVPLK